jgi:glutamine cyclotransferase
MNDWDYGNNCLNGIAADRETGNLFVTGKRWSLFFKI